MEKNVPLPSNIWLLKKKRWASRGPILVPEVHISAESLLQALIALAHQIMSLEKPRECQRRNTVCITRKVKVLSILFEEVRDSGNSLPPSALKSFRGLFIMLQRSKHLLEDCSSDGSCAWFYLQTQEISKQFYRLIQEKASALDILPLTLLDLSDEVKEQVELLHHQARRTKLFVDQAEEQLCSDVFAVLDEFDKEVASDESQLRRILDGLNLQNAMDCQRETELLEEEIRCQKELGSEKNLSQINTLIAFIRYCKCVLFWVEYDTQFQPSSRTQTSKVDSERASNSPMPDDFRCPISLDKSLLMYAQGKHMI